MARSQLLSLVLVAACAWMGLQTLFVGSSQGLRSSKVAMQAADVVASAPGGKVARVKGNPPEVQDPQREDMMLSTGASNKVMLITPVIDTGGLQAYLSLSPVLLVGLLSVTIGGLLEAQRFFPDCNFW
ncbi:unnamed protein product [Polarella glacialis]|uniref:PSI-J n=1 Tax=Polarella glacialis TaxID=89957 RepID=A0A813G483_POLGL|nr:unnamed protein product [Polarella glacialis]CAE8612173.1 unnamed protein product [Polarella glacialis]CAE8621393.1 unnamed protein product [Polarella glacialis]CAE8684001.1 unnamed protein product [Polarella glacialis]|mmetsp:Transcript_14879/g.23638  ORF Transcript_14879/g.23638 Transcript_14879/m.23638 type:complete len:128 (+) Transcript_14879:99-482(+)